MTDSTTESTTDSATDQAPTDKYFDALLASYDALANAIEQANERGLRISRQLLTDVTAAQRQALDLAKQVAANPSDTAAAYSAIMESAPRRARRLISRSRRTRKPSPPVARVVMRSTPCSAPAEPPPRPRSRSHASGRAPTRGPISCRRA